MVDDFEMCFLLVFFVHSDKFENELFLRI